MSQVGIMIGSKGGIGKTTACLHWAQAKVAAGRNVACIDTDASTKTLAQFSGLDVSKVEVVSDEQAGAAEVQEWRHNAIFEQLSELPADTDVIVDSGASNYVQMLAWMMNSEVFDTLQAMGRDLELHTVIGGGADFVPSLACLGELRTNLPATIHFTVWLNPHGGSLELNGTSFFETKTYEETKARISSIITLPRWAQGTLPLIERMLKDNKTYDEALADEALALWDRPRLRRAKEEIFSVIEGSLC